ncbi:hypothetical protein AJ85_14140 [Alkalihalobacillus alcalophilus ATCC 27647 = CGMCC 1.3604]|uniref:DUF3796 domain-containing protein n=1 Tax=Alkalihalobacillus alcalophilus ATCC 27647 = CGMCC 1.3604 TaxID=1218173 RepID=A0A094WI41_ALKAL|nr:hypothetical protein [Alkalihalobacillus alcalophilus]KGA97459.1 hypothetical protein BALCAV_0210290 [Alkalihalobacillus alcalophilus ATCC 27647 = CGMCC 1.3604]MED1562221.1 hypothetical protein [Alkalihalobacillus alcalophilus]THG89983.1 hypothetical protein AJ85_14140 [Alkalihalobacillus alcalophilus ATCC 27647 = CGMCC 1.3604]
MSNLLWASSGIFLAIIIQLITWYFVRRNGQKKYLYDERHKQTTSFAKATAWNVSFVVILVAWFIIAVVEGASLAFFLFTGVYIIHTIAFGIAIAFETGELVKLNKSEQ